MEKERLEVVAGRSARSPLRRWLAHRSRPHLKKNIGTILISSVEVASCLYGRSRPTEEPLAPMVEMNADGKICAAEGAADAGREGSPRESEHSIGQIEPRAPKTKCERGDSSFVDCAAKPQVEEQGQEIVRVGAAPPEKTPCPNRTTALEKTICGFADNAGDNVIVATLGASFDSLGEAYYFYTCIHGRKDLTLDTSRDYCHRQIKRKEMGRSTTSREKVTYYGLSKKTTFCTIFRRQGTKGLCAQTAEMYQSRLGDVLDARTVESKFTAGTIATMQRSYV
uniref:Uncharacterized protein n=1 Tax=Aegilops tauschii TaxID=37682 RepID=M8AQK4_AEGTA